MGLPMIEGGRAAWLWAENPCRPAARMARTPPLILLRRFSGKQSEREVEAVAVAAADLSLADGVKPKATKKEKVKKTAPAPAEARPVDISRVDLRVGLINKAWRHPGAERYAGGTGSVPMGDVRACARVWRGSGGSWPG